MRSLSIDAPIGHNNSVHSQGVHREHIAIHDIFQHSMWVPLKGISKPATRGSQEGNDIAFLHLDDI
jgi:hypothetical protein